MSEVTVNTQVGVPPTYLNAELWRKALAKAHGAGCDVTLSSCDIQRIGGDGENFCSDIYRVRLAYECISAGEKLSLQKRLIVKDMHMDIAALGSSECQMLEQVLPQMEQILNERMKQPVRLIAKLYHADCVDKELYVMEDLTAAGYTMADRWLGLDEPHARKLLEKIAQFHAASMLYVARCPAVAATLPKAHFAAGAGDALSESISFGGIRHAIDIVAQWQDFEDVADKMRGTLGFFNERMRALVLGENKINVINHGDLWVNNTLFSYDEDQQPKDVIFVDFQNCYLGSPALDLNYFLQTSVQLDVLKRSRYELLRHYYAALRRTLVTCGAAKLVPTWQTLVEEVRRLEFIGYYAAVCELPICCMDATASKGFTAQTFTDPVAMVERRQLMYDNQRVLETLRYALDRFNELGVLD